MIGTVSSAPPIACRGLTKRFGAVVGVEDLDLELEPGRVVGFLGANGAGKSTTIRMLVGLLRPTAGQALLWGEPAADAQARQRLGYMPADPAFYLALSGTENLDLLAAVHGRGSPDRASAADLLGLDAGALRRPVGEYSSGMVQKLALIQAVQHRPDLVILDEPANRLDPLAHRRFEQLVRAIADAGRTVFLSSHTLSEVQDVCDSVAMIRAGRLLAHRSVAELSDLGTRRLRAVFRDGMTHEAALAKGDMAPLRELLAREDLVDLTVEPATLEEAFVELYGERV